MVSYILENSGTLAVGLIVAGITAAIIAHLLREKRKGKSIGCGCGCTDCQSQSGCSVK